MGHIRSAKLEKCRELALEDNQKGVGKANQLAMILQISMVSQKKRPSQLTGSRRYRVVRGESDQAGLVFFAQHFQHVLGHGIEVVVGFPAPFLAGSTVVDAVGPAVGNGLPEIGFV